MNSLTNLSNSVAMPAASGRIAQKKSFLASGRPMLFLLLLLVSLTGLDLSLSAQFTGPALMTPPAQRNPVVPTTAATVLYPKNQVIYLSPGDLVAVHIYGSLEYAPIVRSFRSSAWYRSKD